jgi:hypothetical protein
MFTKGFDDYVCDGDTIRCTVDGFECTATIYRDNDADAPDEMCSGFWPSLDPKSDGYIGPKSKSTLARQMAHAKHVMESWKRDFEWWYVGVAVTVEKAGVQLTGDYDNACWGTEANYPSTPGQLRKYGSPNKHLTELANEELSEALDAAKAKLAELCAA